jgi:energy-coupling factor transporter ATP-binding protein EcfA2
MAIPININREHLLKAVEKIDLEGIPKDGDSQYYDVHLNGKRYPPKLIVSYANIFANGRELDRTLFKGGIGTPCFRLLEENGFHIVKRPMTPSPNIWFVTQGSTFNEDMGMQFLFAPKVGRDNRPRFYWDNVSKVKKGDIIFNYSGSIKAISIAQTDGYPTTEENAQWSNEGYRVDIALTHLNPPIPRDHLKKNRAHLNNYLASLTNKPFDRNGGVNQGYLFEFTKEAGRYIRNLYGKPFGNAMIDDFFDKITLAEMRKETTVGFEVKSFSNKIWDSGLHYSDDLLSRFTASLLTKPFVILTGLSGSGKTKLAQAFVQWICQNESQYRIIPVGADWTNREPLLGYPNALKPEEYVKPDSGVLDLIIKASNQPELPHFLILDEMNLSHVERYFADFLSVMESKEEIPLYAEGTVQNGVPAKLKVPSNLFIIGTVNIDETTNMFSPKVLDRANTIEFRVTQDEMKNFLSNIRDINMDALTGKGAGMAKSFLEMAASKDFATTDIAEINAALVQFFGELKKTGTEFGYRSATEILRLIHQLTVLDNTLTTHQKIDIAIMQKLLPKLHGSRRKLCPVLETLGSFCITGDIKIIKDVFEKADFDFNGANVAYPLSLEKIARMYRGAIDNGFASFAEA